MDRKAVSGTVTLDDTPLASGMISLDPAEGSAGAVPAGGVIVDGKFSIDAASGPTPGKYKVSIRSASADAGPPADEAPGEPPPPKKGSKGNGDPIPAKYNTASELTAEVSSDGLSPSDFKLTTK